MNIPNPQAPPTATGDIRVSFPPQSGPMAWLRRVTVRIDGDDVGQLEPGQSAQWSVPAGGHVVRVYDLWGRSHDCQVAVAPRTGYDWAPQPGHYHLPSHLHCRVNVRRTAVIKLLAPLWLLAQWLPDYAWALIPAPDTTRRP